MQNLILPTLTTQFPRGGDTIRPDNNKLPGSRRSWFIAEYNVWYYYAVSPKCALRYGRSTAAITFIPSSHRTICHARCSDAWLEFVHAPEKRAIRDSVSRQHAQLRIGWHVRMSQDNGKKLSSSQAEQVLCSIHQSSSFSKRAIFGKKKANR